MGFVSKGNIYLCARHVNAYAPPHTLLTYLPQSESEMTWYDGYDGVFLASETKGKPLVSAGFIVIDAGVKCY